MDTIADRARKIKAISLEMASEWGIFAIMMLVVLGAFGLGRLSTLETARPLVSVYQAPASTATAALALGGQYVASKTGTVYYFPWCSGATKILPQNQRWFSSAAAAERAGYRAAKNCKGLVTE